MNKVLAILLSFVFITCAFNSNYRRSNVRSFTPPFWYRIVWKHVKNCADSLPKRDVDFSDIKFYTTSSMYNPEGDYIVGNSMYPPDIIYLDEEYVGSQKLVGHEMLHILYGVRYPEDSPEFEACDPYHRRLN